MQGHCEYLKERFPGVGPLQVVLAYDVRQFEDQRKQLQSRPAEPGPAPVVAAISPIMRRAFMRPTASMRTILPPDSQRLPGHARAFVHHPQLSAHGGLNVSASHNPPDDNGGKFYDERGGQPVPPEDQIMADLVDQVTRHPHAALSGCGPQPAACIFSMKRCTRPISTCAASRAWSTPPRHDDDF